MGGWNANGTVDLTGIDQIEKALQKYGDEAQFVITKYLLSDSLNVIGPAITRLLPVSGRTFAGHLRGAKETGFVDTFTTSLSTLDSVFIRSRPNFNYLWFPDDGGNTRHAGKQHFMLRGAEAAVPQIASEICSRLAEKFEEG